MREPPSHVSEAEVLSVVIRHWAHDATDITHLPVGFGAHHWRVSGSGSDLFVTLDALLPRHSAESLERAYSSAAHLADQGLEFVLSGVRSVSGTFTVAIGGGALSAVPWRDGRSGRGPHIDEAEARSWAGRLARLHAATPSADLPRWRPLVPPTLADRLTEQAD